MRTRYSEILRVIYSDMFNLKEFFDYELCK